MTRFVSYSKMSKKQRRAIDLARRGSWNGLSPVTRIAEPDKRRYTRKCKHKARAQDAE